MTTRNYRKNLEKFVARHWPGAIRKEAHGGSEFRFVCPFCHGGRTRELSFDINIKKGTAQCWRSKCGWRGTSNWFLSQYLNISPKDAFDLLSGEVEISVEALITEIEELRQELFNRFDLPGEKIMRSFDSFWESCEILEGSSVEDDVVNWIEHERNYDPGEFLQVHTLFAPPPLEEWESRVVFQVDTNDMTAYQMYAFVPGIKPKTLNPPGEVLSSFLYNYNEVKDSPEPIFVTEGIFDAARLISWGYNAVCTFGTNMSEYQAYLLSRTRSDEIVMLYDNGAENKAKTAVKLLAQHCYEKEITRVHIPIEKADPDMISEEQLLKFYERRTRYVPEIDRMRNKIIKVQNRWN